MGPVPRSKGGFKYIVVFQDFFTMYIEVRALRSANSVTIGKAFEELILNRWGCPKYLLTDNGSEYVNNTMKKRINKLGIIQTTIAPYHEQANPVERVNRTIKTMISIYVKNNHKLWDVYLNEFTFDLYSINTTPNSSTKYSPAYLNFGRNPRMIVTLLSDPDAHKNQNVYTKKQRHQENYTTQTAADDEIEEPRYHLRRRRTPASPQLHK
ncbi:hypothetical protein TKK_0005523 [Trichogramma kaykai]